jgi:hypothetical protein
VAATLRVIGIVPRIYEDLPVDPYNIICSDDPQRSNLRCT